MIDRFERSLVPDYGYNGMKSDPESQLEVTAMAH